MVTAEIEPVVGRYLWVDVAGRRCRIYYEEAGSGRPLVCLHTAGADSRQFRHLLNDSRVTEEYRVIAFDLPAHGRSLPPDDWWTTEYLLSTEAYVAAIMAFLNALELKASTLLGCSMAGSVVLEMARRHPDLLEAVIGLSGAAYVEGRFADWSLDPDVNAALAVPSWVYGLMAPQSPLARRQETWWIYSQGGPGIYRGDTFFYSEEWDLRGHESEIDTTACPVYLMTGEYDYACSAEESRETAAAIPGAHFVFMTDIGHFPMSENYPLFASYLLPVLQEISTRHGS